MTRLSLRPAWLRALTLVAAITSALCLATTGTVVAGALPPGNDNFANRMAIGSLPFDNTRNIANATLETNEPVTTCTTISRSVWYSYTPSVTRVVRADTLRSNFGLSDINVYKGTVLTSLTQVDCNNGISQHEDSRSSLAWRAVAGVHYAIQVATTAADTGTTLKLHLQAVSPPANDAFANARVVASLPFTATFSNRNATRESAEPNLDCAKVGATVWYRFKPSATMTVLVDTLDSDTDTTIGIFRGASLGALTQVTCNDDTIGGFDGYQSSVAFRALKGTTYYIQAGGYQASSGNLAVRIRKATSPSNDAFANALVIGSVPFYTTENTRVATSQAGEPVPSCAATGATVWFKRTAGLTGTLTFDTIGSSFPTETAAYTGSTLSDLVQVDCRASTGPLSVPVTAGDVVYYQVGGAYEPQSGGLSVHVSEAP